MTNYITFTKRILALLQDNEKLKSIVSDWKLSRVGSEGDVTYANSYPLIYVTPAPNPLVSKKTIASSDYRKIPGQERVLEFWAVIICSEATPEETQETIFEIEGIVTEILENNAQLRKPDGKDALCASADIFTQKRHEKFRGEIVEAMTVRIRPTIYVLR